MAITRCLTGSFAPPSSRLASALISTPLPDGSLAHSRGPCVVTTIGHRIALTAYSCASPAFPRTPSSPCSPLPGSRFPLSPSFPRRPLPASGRLVLQFQQSISHRTSRSGRRESNRAGPNRACPGVEAVPSRHALTPARGPSSDGLRVSSPGFSRGLRGLPECRVLEAQRSSIRVPEELPSGVCAEELDGVRYRHIMRTKDHVIYGDLGPEYGGTGYGPSPKQLVLAGLAMDASLAIRIYSERKGWQQLKSVRVEVREHGRGRGQIPEGLEVLLHLEGDLTREQRAALLQIAGKCPIKNLLLGKMTKGVSTRLAPRLDRVQLDEPGSDAESAMLQSLPEGPGFGSDGSDMGSDGDGEQDNRS